MTSTSTSVTTLFLDIGGVLLTNGWDHQMRRNAAEKFGLDYEELNERHHLTFDTYEVGKVSLEKYLDRTVFFEPRDFSRKDFKDFMFAQSQPIPDSIDFFKQLKERHRLVVAAVSNEGRELTEYRVERFDLRSLIDFFICSAFVHFRKPDEDLYRLALDTAQASPENVLYIDDREMFVQVANDLGIRGIHHRSLESTRSELEKIDLTLEGVKT
ncbi:MAG: HAD-IA family hydrolase [Candidatus Omnitrophica bacterium]|nr:HAD-IA family hydrolase [Candidatus Omnitrophota bacterium]